MPATMGPAFPPATRTPSPTRPPGRSRLAMPIPPRRSASSCSTTTPCSISVRSRWERRADASRRRHHRGQQQHHHQCGVDHRRRFCFRHSGGDGNTITNAGRSPAAILLSAFWPATATPSPTAARSAWAWMAPASPLEMAIRLRTPPAASSRSAIRPPAQQASRCWTTTSLPISAPFRWGRASVFPPQASWRATAIPSRMRA